MSALLHASNFQRSPRRISELEAIKSIVRLKGSGGVASGLEAMAAVVLRVRGLHGIEISLPGLTVEGELFARHGKAAPGPRGSASAFVSANGRDRGRLSIFFEPASHSLESPLRFARFLGQELALLIEHAELAEQNHKYQARIRRLEERIETRKTVHRVAGLVAASRSCSHDEAVRLLIRRARESKSSLLQLANSALLGDALRRPVFRHLKANEPTGFQERPSG